MRLVPFTVYNWTVPQVWVNPDQVTYIKRGYWEQGESPNVWIAFDDQVAFRVEGSLEEVLSKLIGSPC